MPWRRAELIRNRVVAYYVIIFGKYWSTWQITKIIHVQALFIFHGTTILSHLLKSKHINSTILGQNGDELNFLMDFERFFSFLTFRSATFLTAPF